MNIEELKAINVQQAQIIIDLEIELQSYKDGLVILDKKLDKLNEFVKSIRKKRLF